eukprot:TRINITY_DN14_c0_g2_i5.p1 TRINITY_DN14_c0_g2~~TRINITY_DN14_c0_g2_i5.p1  ORF type:complete len:109 (-),score=17.73 TRINITY_DN14_c0_g2_i5:365-691(-)
MLEVLIDNKLEPYLLPVIQGSFQNFQVEIGKEIVDVTLIARRCTRRTEIRREKVGDSALEVVTDNKMGISSRSCSTLKVRRISLIDLAGSESNTIDGTERALSFVAWV